MNQQLLVYQIKVARDYDDTPDYMIFESGNFSHPLIVLSEFEAKRLRDALDAALSVKSMIRARKAREGK